MQIKYAIGFYYPTLIPTCTVNNHFIVQQNRIHLILNKYVVRLKKQYHLRPMRTIMVKKYSWIVSKAEVNCRIEYCRFEETLKISVIYPWFV